MVEEREPSMAELYDMQSRKTEVENSITETLNDDLERQGPHVANATLTQPVEYEFHELAYLYPDMTDDAFDGLRASMRKWGYLDNNRITIWTPDDETPLKVIDGRHRYKAAIAEDAEPLFYTLASDADPLDYVLSLNSNRRDLTVGQKAFIAAEISESQQGARKDLTSSTWTKLSLTDAAERVGVSRQTIDKAHQLLDCTFVDVQDLINRVEKDSTFTINQAITLMDDRCKIEQEKRDKKQAEDDKKEAEKQARLDALKKLAAESDQFTIYESSCRDLIDKIPAGSVKFIVTDPPYPREFIPVFDELREFAIHALAPGGSLLVLTGQTYLPQYIEKLTQDPELEWMWLLSVNFKIAAYSPRHINLNSGHKPILWLAKKPFDGYVERDVIEPVAQSRRSDEYDEWGQEITIFTDLFSKFRVPEGELIVDPFCGGGGIGEAALSCNLRYIGSDINADDVQITRGRLSKYLESRDAEQFDE